MPPMQAGEVIAGKYRLEALLDRGGMGAVWRALHLDLGAPVAVKLMDAGIASHPDALARFHREARAAARLRSPHVVQILDHGVDVATRSPYIVMELLEGESLGERLVRERVLSTLDTARIVSDVCRALVRAHEAGIVHRDIKPSNIFLVRNDDQELAKVLDFGVAKAESPALNVEAVTQSGSMLGTPLYMSPEQIGGGREVDFRSDLWSLGVIACECLTGRRPFLAETVGALAVQICTQPAPRPSDLGPVPPGFDEWFERAVARNPAHRFASARELAEALRRVCGGPALESGDAEPLLVERRPRFSTPTPEGFQLPPTEPVVSSEVSTGDLLGSESGATRSRRRGRRGISFGAAGLAMVLGAWLGLFRDAPTTATSARDTASVRSRPAESPPAPIERASTKVSSVTVVEPVERVPPTAPPLPATRTSPAVGLSKQSGAGQAPGPRVRARPENEASPAPLKSARRTSLNTPRPAPLSSAPPAPAAPAPVASGEEPTSEGGTASLEAPPHKPTLPEVTQTRK